MEFPIRINKYLAHKGYATRRDADTLIADGKVFVNNIPALIGQKITATDVVEVRNVPTRHFRYLRYYKPRGVITHSPAEGEVDIETQLSRDHSLTGVFPIGRLDKDAEGLMLLSDDGRVTERILNPERKHTREYEVTVDKKVTPGSLEKLQKGVNIEGYVTRPAKAKPLREKTFLLILTEGKKHQIRRMCAALGYQVTGLKRTRILDLSLGTLKKGACEELTKTERDRLLGTLGLL